MLKLSASGGWDLGSTSEITFLLVGKQPWLAKWMDGWMDVSMDRWIDGWMDRTYEKTLEHPLTYINIHHFCRQFLASPVPISLTLAKSWPFHHQLQEIPRVIWVFHHQFGIPKSHHVTMVLKCFEY